MSSPPQRPQISALLIYKLPPFGTPTNVPLSAIGRYDSSKSDVSVYEDYEGGDDEGVAGKCVRAAMPVRNIESPPSVSSSNLHKIVYLADSHDRCYALICSVTYPLRTSVSCLRAAHYLLVDKVTGDNNSMGMKSLTDTASKFRTKIRPDLKALVKRFNGPGEIDKVAEVMGKIDVVKVTMQDNIAVMLESSEKLEEIDKRSELLTEQSLVFKRKSNKLRKVMRCKNRKMNLAIAFLFLLVGGIIALVIVLSTTNNNNKR